MAHNITLIPGDGIGPEVTSSTRRIIDATGVHINWEISRLRHFFKKREFKKLKIPYPVTRLCFEGAL